MSEPCQEFDRDIVLCRAKEFLHAHRSSSESPEISASESDKLLQECILDLQTGFKQIESEFSEFTSLESEDLEAYLEHVKKELKAVGSERAEISVELKDLSQTFLEDSIRVENDLEGLDYAIKFLDAQGINELQIHGNTGSTVPGENRGSPLSAFGDYNFKILELDHLIEKNKTALRSIQDLHHISGRIDAIGQIEDMLSEVKIIELEGNCIRLSMRTPLQTSVGLLCQQKLDFVIEPSTLDHELLIELIEGTMELKNAELFPSDVYIGEVIDAAKLVRSPFLPISFIEIRSSLEWLVRKVQYRIVLSTLRRLIVKDANKSRHSFEYSDRDEMVVARLVEGFDAFIKIPHSWPASTSVLQLTCLKSSNIHSVGKSSSILCKVEELANSLDVQIRQQLLSFVDAIEGIFNQQKYKELPSNHIPLQ